ncbi:MAG: DUF4129 domain-containing protein [Fimbriimonadales bacterium]|nr:DUF4129 domain-containing protein [Fimbriimonadales bacterium]
MKCCSSKLRAKGLRLACVWIALLVAGALAAQSPLEAFQRAERALESAQRAKPSDRKVFLQRAERALAPLPPAAREPLKAQIAKGELSNALRTLRDYRNALQPAPAPDAAQVKAQLNAIFAEPDMQIPPKSFVERITEQIQRAFETLARWLQRLLGGLGGSGLSGMTPVFQWLVIVLLVLTIALAASYILGRVQLGRRAPSPTLSLDAAFRDARSMSALEWRELARRLAYEQEWQLALRAYYLGLLRLLHESRLLDYDPALTNWEHLQRLRQPAPPRFAPASTPLPDPAVREEAYGLMRPLTLQFDAVWYGGATPDTDALQRCELAFETLLRKVQSHAVPA